MNYGTTSIFGLVVSVVGLAPQARAQATFDDITGRLGLTYERTPSTAFAALQAAMRQPEIPITQLPSLPENGRGRPGVAVFDYDGDGDLDIYATNGPGSPNSLYRNQLRQTGVLAFDDVAVRAGVGATTQDSTGVCFGDIDNDGDSDLLVLGRAEPNRLFENVGRGRFRERTPAGELGLSSFGSAAAAMGDVDGDGLLDIYVANAATEASLTPVMFEPFAENHPNRLYRNVGNNRFVDVTQASGLDQNPPLITWATVLVDYDRDGDLDIIEANDQAAVPRAAHGGVDRGFLHVFRNDGSGRFSPAHPNLPIGEYMGIDVADFNSDGHLDLIVTNSGDWLLRQFGLPIGQGEESTRWYLGDGAGGFTDPGVGALGTGPFGWGCAAEDYDNDGDTDIVHVGGLQAFALIDLSNPGTVLANDGTGSFTYDHAALGESLRLRTDYGLAMGDLDGDGFLDLVTVANMDVRPPTPVVPYPFTYGSEFDPALLTPIAQPIVEGGPLPAKFIPTGVEAANGTLVVQRNRGNGNSAAQITAAGSVGLTRNARATRDGIGAVIDFTPRGGKTATRPVLGGSSHASQSPLARHFGMGRATMGTVEVLWPGGVRNRLYDVRAGERIVMPEIPCSFDGQYSSLNEYARCVSRALLDLLRARSITPPHAVRLFVSALRARLEG